MDIFSGDPNNLIPTETLLTALEGVAKKRQSLDLLSTQSTTDGRANSTTSSYNVYPHQDALLSSTEMLKEETLPSKAHYWFSDQVTSSHLLTADGEHSVGKGTVRPRWVSPQTSPLPSVSPREDAAHNDKNTMLPKPAPLGDASHTSDDCNYHFSSSSSPTSVAAAAATSSCPTSRETPSSVSSSPTSMSLVKLLSGENVYGETVDAYLEIGELLGYGANGKVYKAKYQSTGEVVAVKKVKKEAREKKGLVNSFGKKMLNMALKYQHPNLIHYRQFFEDPMSIYIVSDLYTGPDLHTYIASRAPMSEDAVAVFAKQVMEALVFFHSFGVVHRDIKPENFMFEDQNCTNLRLIDCGNATLIPSSGIMSICGTAGFVAPEVFTGNYCQKCDLFSVGVILFCAVTNKYPFRGTGNDLAQHARELENTDIATLENDLFYISKAAQDFILGLLEFDPEKRLSASDALQAEWMTRSPHNDAWTQFG